MKTTYPGGLCATLKCALLNGAAYTFFVSATLVLTLQNLKAQTTELNSDEKRTEKRVASAFPNSFSEQGSHEFSKIETDVLYSADALDDSGGLIIKDRTEHYFAVASGKITEAVWSQSMDGDPQIISSWNKAMELTIPNGANITMDVVELRVLHLNVEHGAELNLGTSRVFVAGNLVNDGKINAEESEVVFNGSVEQTFAGTKSTVLHTLISDNPIRLTIEGAGVEITNLLQINSGEFKTNGKLLLKSTADHTAMIGPLLGNADIKNNVTVQFYHQALAQNWINLCAPVQGKTVADWDDDLVTTGFQGADYPSYPVNNILFYSESEEGDMGNGFIGVAQSQTPLINKRGYFVFANPGVLTIDMEGTIFKGDQSIPVAYTPSENSFEDGWNLVANPYMCTIDWDSPYWIKNKIEKALYVWNESKQQYSSYISGVGNNGGSALIEPMKSFFVQANGDTPSLNISESVKNVSGVSITESHSSSDILNISIHNVHGQDETTLAWRDNATEAYERDADALKLKSPAPVPFLSTISSEGIDLSVNTMDRGKLAHTIAFNVEVPENAIYTFTWNGAPDFSAGSCIVFRDAVTNQSYALNELDHINIELTAGSHLGRFFLEVGVPALKSVVEPTCHGYADGTALVQGEGEGPWSVIWTNAKGEVIRQVENVYDQDVMSGLSAGYYEVIIEDNGFCSNTHTSLIISQPEKIELISQSTAETCPQNSDGAATLNITGGAEPYKVLWENGQVGTSLNDVHSGLYLAVITDKHGCSSTEAVEVPSLSELEADFETFGNRFELKNGSVLVDFYNTSISGEEFVWNFGDGTVLRIEDNPSHMYNKAGDYDVTLEISDDDCVSTIVKSIHIDQLGESDADLSGMINGVLTENGILLSFVLDHPRTLRICAWNVLGQQLIAPRVGQYYIDTMQLSEKNYATGSLVEIVDESTGERTVIKF